MDRVYRQFASNLQHLLEAGHRSEVRMVLSTVGTNLRDCAPFASRHRPGLAPEDQARWEAAYREGMELQDRGDHTGAINAYARALEIDDHHAELHFRLARCLQTLERWEAAATHYRHARDRDALRFRADSRLNQVVRDSAARHAGPRFRLFDAEAGLAQLSPDGVPGREHFFEHVHLTPSGNYHLARGMADLIVDLLELGPETAESAKPWASADDCWRWLSLTDRNRYNMLANMQQRMSAPPFTQQFGHDRDLALLVADQNPFRTATRPTQIQRMVREVRATVALRPGDAELRMILAELLDLAGEAEAETEWRAATRLLPNAPMAWSGLGRCLQRLGRLEQAAQAYRRCLELFPWHYDARAGLREVSRAPAAGLGIPAEPRLYVQTHR